MKTLALAEAQHFAEVAADLAGQEAQGLLSVRIEERELVSGGENARSQNSGQTIGSLSMPGRGGWGAAPYRPTPVSPLRGCAGGNCQNLVTGVDASELHNLRASERITLD